MGSEQGRSGLGYNRRFDIRMFDGFEIGRVIAVDTAQVIIELHIT